MGSTARIVFPWRLFTAATINATAAITSPVIDVRYIDRLEALTLEMTSTANAHDIKVQWQVAPPAHVPAKISDPAYNAFSDVTDFVTLSSSTATDFPNSATSVIVMSLPPVLGAYVKFIFTGVGANPANTALTAVLLGREK